MKITRRTALLGVVGGMIGGLAPAPVLSASPFLMTIQAEQAVFRRRRWVSPFDSSETQLSPWQIAQYYTNNPPPSPLQTRAIVCSDGMSVKSVEAAEDVLFASIQVVPLLLPSCLTPPLYVGDAMTWPHVQLNRQCNLIAARTRIGAGNIVLMSSATFSLLELFSRVTGNPIERITTDYKVVGRWTRIGVMNNVIPIWISDHMPPMEIVVMYRGFMDDAVLLDHSAVLLNKPHGLTLVHDSLSDYVRRVRFFDPTDSGVSRWHHRTIILDTSL